MKFQRGLLVTWSVLLTFIQDVHGCLVMPDYTEKTVFELLDMADIVVYGRDTEHIYRVDKNMTASLSNVTDCIFQVFCILKGGVTDKMITIEHIGPLTPCSGTIDKLQVGMEMIVALKMTKSGSYKYYEGNPLQSSVYADSAENFQTMAEVNNINEWKIPTDATTNTCLTAMDKGIIQSAENIVQITKTTEEPKQSTRNSDTTAEEPDTTAKTSDTTTEKSDMTTEKSDTTTKISNMTSTEKETEQSTAKAPTAEAEPNIKSAKVGQNMEEKDAAMPVMFLNYMFAITFIVTVFLN